MKWYIGFVVLLVALVAISGCTQSTQTTAPATTVPTTAPTTEPVLVATPVPTTVATTVATTVTTKVPTAANVTLNTTAGATPQKTVTAASRVTTIHITSAGFNPALDVVLPGTGITWVNDDSVSHTVKAIGNHEGLFTSSEIIPTSQFSFSFGVKEDTFEYALGDLPTVKGKIIVKAGASVVGV